MLIPAISGIMLVTSRGPDLGFVVGWFTRGEESLCNHSTKKILEGHDIPGELNDLLGITPCCSRMLIRTSFGADG
jgi:hypothetical protein